MLAVYVAKTTGVVRTEAGDVSPGNVQSLCMYRMFFTLRRFPYVKVGRLHGAVVGGGVAFALHTEQRFGTDSTSYGFGNLPRSAIPGMLLSTILSRSIGLHNSMYAYVTDIVFDACSGVNMQLM